MTAATDIWSGAVNIEGRMFALRTATTAELADDTADINTTPEKVAGALCYNTTAETVVVATGPLVGDVWNLVEAGTAAHTPV